MSIVVVVCKNCRHLKHICERRLNSDVSINFIFAVDKTVCDLGVLKQSEMENCTKPETYDYFDGSEVSYALTFMFLGVFVVGRLVLIAHF